MKANAFFMTTEHYQLTSSRSNTIFAFESKSEIKVVRKIITYSVLSVHPLVYNLALADVVDQNIVSDKEITNNGDMPKIIATVVKSLFQFFAMHPTASVYIIGNTPARTRLYRMIIDRELAEIQKFFEIYGDTKSGRELFVASTNYDAYLIKIAKTLRYYGN